ncbi:MAG: hypothetical protein K0Q72_2732, partial [Armatimonadetes bacterium]|nr:hypothetical protein [Armatimonadota bacterium]
MMRRHAPAAMLLLTLSGVIVAAAPPTSTPAKPSAGALEYFEKHVRPVLAEQCYPCHGPRLQQGGLRLDRPDFLRAAAGTEPLVKPGDPDGSRFIQAVRHTGGLKMPPARKLPAAQIEVLVDWVRAGAAWPAERMKDEGGRRKAEHWAFRPVTRPPVPAVKNTAWVKTPIDAFVLAELEKRGLRPAPPADPRTLIRRAYYDLIGLPPTAAEVAAFERECAQERSLGRSPSFPQHLNTRTPERPTSPTPNTQHPTPNPGAYARLIDRLLAMPQYGERWGRYWLDVARYADTRGYVRLTEERFFPYAYTYRDYVVRAFNEDLPYNRFVLEQLAADELPPGTADPAALGFLTLGRRFTGNRHDIIDDRIDVVSRGL